MKEDFLYRKDVIERFWWNIRVGRIVGQFWQCLIERTKLAKYTLETFVC
jgi:hypothetical protein